MSSAEKRPGPLTVAYLLLVLGIILIPVGLLLTLLRECTPSCEFVYMQQGLIAVGVGLFILFFAIILFFLPQQREGSLTGPTSFCPTCGGPTVWIAPESRWYCQRCRTYSQPKTVGGP